MSPESEFKISRRDLLAKSSALFLLASCNSSVLFEENQDGAKEIPTKPRLGDVITIGNNSYLLRDNKALPILNFEKYRRLSKMDEYGRRVWTLTGSVPSNYALGEVDSAPGVIDIYSGQFKRGKKEGGEINVYFPGFMTDKGVPYDIIEPEQDTFVDIRTSLKENRWEPHDSLFFTYGAKAIKNFAQYESRDTANSPVENIEHALGFMEYLKESFPLAQFNLIAHSLRGIFALEATRKYEDAINNLILINSPVKGIDGNIARRAQVTVLKQALKPLLGDEKVTDYLFSLWRDSHHRELEKFVQSFIKKGRKLSIVVAEDDPIVPKESSVIEGADIITLKVGNVSILRSLEAHGKPLRDDKVIKVILQKIGPNLAAA